MEEEDDDEADNCGADDDVAEGADVVNAGKECGRGQMCFLVCSSGHRMYILLFGPAIISGL